MEPNHQLPQTDTDTSAGVVLGEYFARFPFHLVIRVGPVYTSEFKEFNTWCNDHLGIKYKDWFLSSYGKSAYKLYMRDTKHSMFLALRFSEIVDSSKL